MIEVNINIPITLTGFLTVRDSNNNIIISCKNSITNSGCKQLAMGNGVSNLKYIAVGRGETATKVTDESLESEISRYSIDQILIQDGQAIITAQTDDNLIVTIQEFGLFYNSENDTDSKDINSGIIFSRVVTELERLHRQKLMFEWIISVS